MESSMISMTTFDGNLPEKFKFPVPIMASFWCDYTINLSWNIFFFSLKGVWSENILV